MPNNFLLNVIVALILLFQVPTADTFHIGTVVWNSSVLYCSSHHGRQRPCFAAPPPFNNHPDDSQGHQSHHPTKNKREEGKRQSSSRPPLMIRLNKCFKATHSRRQADALIAQPGRVTVNQKHVSGSGIMVRPHHDVIHLDGKRIVGWESLNAIFSAADTDDDESANKPSRKDSKTRKHSSSSSSQVFEYIKYWKPRGVTCTTDRRIPGNILDQLEQRDGYRNNKQRQTRIYPVGRLDKDTTGLILLTNDGRLPNAVLRQAEKRPKVYNVLVDRPVKPIHVEQLRSGVVITTVAQRDGRTKKPLTAKTLPCLVRQHTVQKRRVQMTLYEGRNRQVRKMLEAVGGYQVVQLHRVSFGGISLQPLQGPGCWERIQGSELRLIQKAVQEYSAKLQANKQQQDQNNMSHDASKKWI